MAGSRRTRTSDAAMEIGVYIMAPPNRSGVNAEALVVGGAATDPGELVRTAQLREFAVHAEQVGFDAIWVPDHVVMPASYQSTYPYQPADPTGEFQPYPFDDVPFPEALTVLAYLAGATERIRLAAGVMILPERNPVLFAKQLATLDSLSGGRLQMGVGLGWLREEYEALGVPWEQRGRRMDEYMEAMKTLWEPGARSYQGDYVQFSDIYCDPKPVQQGGVPLIVGGHSVPAARRAGRLGDGFIPSALGGSGDIWPLIAEMDRAAEEAGRDPAEIKLYSGCQPELAMVESRAEQGMDGVFMAVFPTDLDSGKKWLDEAAERVLKHRP